SAPHLFKEDHVASSYMQRSDTPPALSVGGGLCALLGASGLAAGMTLLYRSMAVIMETEGGFVASGGPYEIAHPAPGWVWLVPVSILALFAFGGLSLWASMRGWGTSPLAYAWSALFISLGWNFMRLGLFDPPDGQGAAWGWIVSGVAFWAMGLAPALGPVGRAVARARYGPEAISGGARTGMFGLPLRRTTPAYIAAQAIGVVAGVAGGLALFAAVAG
ncbi:MAG: hypothetical protein JXP37_10715, partial [Coriobacteriia bacterium]|nr:hypothetical protein [Coriobacteriia bacterium]